MKSNLYTGTGDDGMTSLVGGERISKTSLRLETYGTIDEVSSLIGVVAASPECPAALADKLKEIQNTLFDIGSYLATPVIEGETLPCNYIGPASIRQLEEWIDRLDEETPRIKAFVLPGGSLAASQCHVARTVCRRAERLIVALSQREYVDPAVIKWINRLSDFLFIAARNINFIVGVPEITWHKSCHSNLKPSAMPK